MDPSFDIWHSIGACVDKTAQIQKRTYIIYTYYKYVFIAQHNIGTGVVLLLFYLVLFFLFFHYISFAFLCLLFFSLSSVSGQLAHVRCAYHSPAKQWRDTIVHNSAAVHNVAACVVVLWPQLAPLQDESAQTLGVQDLDE